MLLSTRDRQREASCRLVLEYSQSTAHHCSSVSWVEVHRRWRTETTRRCSSLVLRQFAQSHRVHQYGLLWNSRAPLARLQPAARNPNCCRSGPPTIHSSSSQLRHHTYPRQSSSSARRNFLASAKFEPERSETVPASRRDADQPCSLPSPASNPPSESTSANPAVCSKDALAVNRSFACSAHLLGGIGWSDGNSAVGTAD